MRGAPRESWSRAARSLIDILIFLAAVAAFEAAFRAVPLPRDTRLEIVAGLFAKLPIALAVWGLLRLQRDSLSTIGLARPRSWSVALLLGSAVALALFVSVFVLERAGFRRDLRAFDFVHGNLELTLYQVGYVLTGAGFYEEFIYRGFLFNRLARLLGDGRVGWSVACVLQAIWFGSGHAYQNATGVVMTGAIGLVMAVLFLACGRSLWPPIIAHGLYDAARTVYFYFNGPP